MDMQFFIGPIVGAIIGGITNGIAIKMLFRPLHPVKIGGYTLPFTPGVIPKERERIAKKVGDVISKELLNEAVLKEWLLKEEIYEQIRDRVKAYLAEAKKNEMSIEDRMVQVLGEERSTFIKCELEEAVTEQLYSKVIKMSIGSKIMDRLKSALKEGSLASLLGPMSFFVNDSLIESLTSKIEPMIDEFIVAEGEDMIRQAVEEESQALMTKPIKEWAERLDDYEEIMTRILITTYQKLVNEQLGRILSKLKIAKIVEERILALELIEVERLILSIMNKELNAIIWLGVLLGGIMGCIMNFF